jgi:threonine dehydrogenase-like Zn-dependent dehydrogenase
MPAVRFHASGKRPVLEEVPVPLPGSGEVRVRVRACGICGSDVHIVHGVTPAAVPLTLGHEPSGVVDDPGDSDWRAGDRVSVAAGYGCGDCALCRADRENICPRLHIPGITRDGAQATYVVVPARALVPLPDSVDFATGAILTDAVATPFHAIKRSGIAAGETAVVYGLGGLGLHAVTILKQVTGARVIGVDPLPAARERALAFGADEVLDSADKPAQRVRALTGGGADATFEFVGNAAVTDQAVKSLRRGGTCTVVGVTPDRLALGLPQALLVAGELRVQGSFGCSRAELAELVGLVGDGRLDLTGTITHRYPLAEFDAGLRTLETKEGDPIRVVVEQPE